MDRSKSLDKHLNSWFSPKCILVQRRGDVVREVERLNGQGALTGIQPNQTPNAAHGTAAVSPWGISSMDERETAQIDG